MEKNCKTCGGTGWVMRPSHPNACPEGCNPKIESTPDLIDFSGNGYHLTNTSPPPAEKVERFEKVEGWISVEDGLPEGRLEPVLLFNSDAPEYNQHVYMGTWFGQDKMFTSNTDRKTMGTITHWMPLPKPPAAS